MLAISRYARWVKPPLQDVAVVIVSSTALDPEVSDQLAVAIAEWNEVAHLRVEDMDGLQADWLAANEGQPPRTGLAACEASELLRSVSQRCYLLDLESGGHVRLAWLGSVCGHALRCLQLDPAMPAQGAAHEQVERVVGVARALVKTLLQERFTP